MTAQRWTPPLPLLILEAVVSVASLAWRLFRKATR